MTNRNWLAASLSGIAISAMATSPVYAGKKEAEVEMTKCATPHGSIAITDGDNQGWTKLGLPNPRGMFGAIVQQPGAAGALGAAPAVSAPIAPQASTTNYTVAVDTRMRATAAAEVRALRAETTLIPTGQKEGLFVKVADTYGTKGWVSVEDLR